MHPAPEVPKLDLSGKLKGLVLVAPLVSFGLDYESATRNEHRDILTKYIGRQWSADYMGGKEINPYANALVAESDWWRNPPVEHVLCVAGTHEFLHDPITEWVEKYKVSSHCTIDCAPVTVLM